MTDEAVTVDTTAEEISTEVVHSPPTLAVMPQVKATELVERIGVIREAMDTAMKADVDYGVIPGTNKPALLKPGAEKLSVLFQLDVQLVNEKQYGPDDHLTVESKATVFHAPTGQRLGFGEGLCTTKERKYAYRRQQRTCPKCEAPAVIKGKEEFGGGWLCWKKRDGCGAKFNEGDQAIEGQPLGDVDNPDLPDLWNTVVKMAEKRARVDAVLAVTGASALFTQDVEPDGPPDPPMPAEPPQGAPDVPTEDVWLEQTREQVRALGLDNAGVREALAQIGVVPPANASLKAVMDRLDGPHRALFTAYLTEQLAKGTPLEVPA